MIQANDICPCGSGQVYKFCHKDIADAPDHAVLAAGHLQYARAWRGNADHYELQHVYGELADALFDACKVRRAIDVGCGAGHGLSALLKRIPADGTLIGIDENPECLNYAAQSIGLPILPVEARRITSLTGRGRSYSSNYKPGFLPTPAQVRLVQSDLMLEDKELEAALSTEERFDAIAIWFSGVHKARTYSTLTQDLGIKNDAQHRREMDRRVFSFALRHLRSGGVLQSAIRAIGVDLPAIEASVLAQASNPPLGLVLESGSISSRVYAEPKKGPRLTMGVVEGQARGTVTGVVSLLYRAT